MVGGPNGAAARLGLRRTTLISKMRRLGINFGGTSVLPVGTKASVPIAEDPTLRILPLSGIFHEDASLAPKLACEKGVHSAKAEREHISEVAEMTDGPHEEA